MSEKRFSPMNEQYLTARKLYGRSTAIQLLIFCALEACVFILSMLCSYLQSFIISLMMRQSPDTLIGVVSAISTNVFFILFQAIGIVMLFLHRRVTFRSAQSVMDNVLPLAGIQLGSQLINRILNVAMQSVFFSNYNSNLYERAAQFFPIAMILALVTAVLAPLASCATIRLASLRGKALLCVLPLLCIVPLDLLNSAAVSCMSISRTFTAMNPVLFLVLASLMPFIVNTLSAFFCQRFLLYRDVCDTVPAVRQRLLRRYQREYPQAFAAASAEPASSTDE